MVSFVPLRAAARLYSTRHNSNTRKYILLRGERESQLGCSCFCLWLSSRCQLSLLIRLQTVLTGSSAKWPGAGHLRKQVLRSGRWRMAQKGCEEQREEAGSTHELGAQCHGKALRQAWRMSVGGQVVLTWVRFSCGNQYCCVMVLSGRISAVRRGCLLL